MPPPNKYGISKRDLHRARVRKFERKRETRAAAMAVTRARQREKAWEKHKDWRLNLLRLYRAKLELIALHPSVNGVNQLVDMLGKKDLPADIRVSAAKLLLELAEVASPRRDKRKGRKPQIT